MQEYSQHAALKHTETSLTSFLRNGSFFQPGFFKQNKTNLTVDKALYLILTYIPAEND